MIKRDPTNPFAPTEQFAAEQLQEITADEIVAGWERDMSTRGRWSSDETTSLFVSQDQARLLIASWRKRGEAIGQCLEIARNEQNRMRSKRIGSLKASPDRSVLYLGAEEAAARIGDSIHDLQKDLKK